MDTPAITGLPVTRPTPRVGRTSDRRPQDNRQRFDDVFERSDDHADDLPEEEVETPSARKLQTHGVRIRRDDQEGPQDCVLPRLVQLRLFRGRGKLWSRLDRLFSEFRFGPISDTLSAMASQAPVG